MGFNRHPAQRSAKWQAPMPFLGRYTGQIYQSLDELYAELAALPLFWGILTPFDFNNSLANLPNLSTNHPKYIMGRELWGREKGLSSEDGLTSSVREGGSRPTRTSVDVSWVLRHCGNVKVRAGDDIGGCWKPIESEVYNCIGGCLLSLGTLWICAGRNRQ